MAAPLSSFTAGEHQAFQSFAYLMSRKKLKAILTVFPSVLICKKKNDKRRLREQPEGQVGWLPGWPWATWDPNSEALLGHPGRPSMGPALGVRGRCQSGTVEKAPLPPHPTLTHPLALQTASGLTPALSGS